MNYFENGILNKNRERACASLSACTVRKMTEEEITKYDQSRKIADDRMRRKSSGKIR